MRLLALLRRLLIGAPPQDQDGRPAAAPGFEHDSPAAIRAQAPAAASARIRPRRARLEPLRTSRESARPSKSREEAAECPYQFATPGVTGNYLDLSRDGDAARLAEWGLPQLTIPRDLAAWLDIPLPKLAWLSGRFYENHRPKSERDAHYHFRWLKKRTAGHRLIEAPKPLLKQIQQRILRDILDRVPAHPQAYGFVRGRSAPLNAEQHVGRYVIVKFDIQNFYASVRYSRIVAIFRSLGYSRVAAIWLSRLTTSAAPASLVFPAHDPFALNVYLPRHLPQGAPTSPALANLSAFSLDVRLHGLAKAYHAVYTRYADDLTFSGSHRFAGALREIIPFAEKIVRQERFGVNKSKRRVIRRSGRQVVTGAVVNERLNMARPEFKRLKAILHNCRRFGPVSQNRDGHADFSAHLAGRIAYLYRLNSDRGRKLWAAFEAIDWTR